MNPMLSKKLHRLCALCLLTCLAAISLLAQDYQPLLGKWSMTSETGGDPIHWTLALKETGGKLTATLVAPDNNEIPAKDFSFTDGVIKFKVTHDTEDYAIALKATADKLAGTWSGGGNSGPTTGTKN
jgi:hypothetical protein